MTGASWLIAGRYRVLGRIGAGGMADVLRAHDELLDRDVAVKVFRSTPPAPDGTHDTAKGVERQQAELAALAKLNHPNLTTLYDGSILGQDGPAYLVMELIDGPSLAQVITDGGLSEAQARIVGAQIADALAYVHAAGMVHRDVKPANILLGHRPGEGMRARLTDFGIVRLVGNEPLTRADMTLGSASYLAPEQARGSAVGPAADIYALGLTLIETITGRRSFDGPALEAVVARLSNDPDIPTDLPAPWPALLRAMTARDPAARPSAAGVAAALRGSAPITPAPPVPRVVPQPAAETTVLPPVLAAAPELPFTRTQTAAQPAARTPERRWSPSLIIAGILVLALVVAGIALLVVNSNESPTPTPTTSRTTGSTSSAASSSSSTTGGGTPSTSTSDSASTAPTTPSSADSSTGSSGPSSASSTTSSSSAVSPPTTSSTSPVGAPTSPSAPGAAGAVAAPPTTDDSQAPG